MLKSILDILPGQLIEIKSKAGGIQQAPFVETVATITEDGFTVVNPAYKDYVFPLSMDNYIGTIDVAAMEGKSGWTMQVFSQ
jgi:hypothetical protein